MTKSAKLQAAIEIISATAVVVTLIFLLVEIRQNTEQTRLNARAVEIAAYQDLISQISDMNKLRIENPEFQKTLMRYANDEPLTEFELANVANFNWLRIRHGDMAYHQFENGTISEERLLTALNIMGLGTKTGRAAWQERRDAFTEGYRNYIDQLVAVKEREDAKAEKAEEKSE